MSKSDWLEEVLEQYESPLIRYAAGIVGDVETARDVVQDTFLRLCRERPAGIGGYLAQWLFTVCRNRALDVLRKENRMRSLSEVKENSATTQDLHTSAGLDEKEQLQHILQTLGQLPKNQQEVVRLKFQQDLSYKEISEITGLSVTNVGFLIHTALKTIREILKGQLSKDMSQAELSPARKALRRVQ